MSTVGSRIALGGRHVGTQDGIVEDIQIRWHAVVAFIVVENLDTVSCTVSSIVYCTCPV